MKEILAKLVEGKDLTEEEYGTLAKEVMNICSRYQAVSYTHLTLPTNSRV